MKRQLLALTTAAGLLLVGAANAPTAAAQGGHQRPVEVVVTGDVTTPLTYTPAQLAALPQTTLPDLRSPHRQGQVTGTLLEPLVEASGPVLPAAKNAALRVTVTVTGEHHERVALALAELAPNNGNHPALLVPARSHGRHRSGVDLVFPGDRGYARTVHVVREVDVTVVAPALPTDVPPGALRIVAGRQTVTLSAATLGALPVQARTVAFRAGNGPQQHLETGPTLASVLRAAHVRTNPTTTVAAIATDGYVATVTPAEATSGRRPLLLALYEDAVPLGQPRLVTDGDVFGARYVTRVVALEVAGARR